MMNDKIIYKRAGEGAEVKEVDIKDLKTLQRLVGGYIQTFPFMADVLIVCNEEGLLQGLAPNIVVHGETLVGNIFFCSYDDEDFIGLDDEQINQIMRAFHMLENGVN